jgi:hypothetical protein
MRRYRSSNPFRDSSEESTCIVAAGLAWLDGAGAVSSFSGDVAEIDAKLLKVAEDEEGGSVGRLATSPDG